MLEHPYQETRALRVYHRCQTSYTSVQQAPAPWLTHTHTHLQQSFAIALVAEHTLAGVAKHDLDIALAMSQCPIQQGIGSVTHTLCIWAGAVGLRRRLVHEMQSHKAIVLAFHIYPFFPPLQGIIGSLTDRQQEAMLLCYQCVGMILWHVANGGGGGGFGVKC